MKNVLIISGHPDLQNSIANKTILDEVATALPNAKIRKLDELYPNFNIDVASEQAELLNADVIVWQFPLSWYSMPALMKKWLDDVFLHGFSHGSTAKLGGKKLIVSFTTGSPAVAYQHDAVMKHTVDEFCYQFETTAILCGLDLQPIVYTNGVSYSARQTAEQIAGQKDLAKEHAKRLITAIQAA